VTSQTVTKNLRNMADAAEAEFLVDGKPVFDDEGNRIISKSAYKKYVAKKEKDAKKAQYKAEKGGGDGGAAKASDEAAPIGPVAYTKEEPDQTFGELVLVQSNQATGREFVHASHLDSSFVGKEVWVRGRVHNTRAKGNNCFIVIRQCGYTVQGALFKTETISKEMIKFAGSLSRETVIDIKGLVVKAEVKSCTQNEVELSVQRLYVVSKAEVGLPLQIDDAGRSEAEIEESERKAAAGEVEGAYVRVGVDIRLDNRIIDLRVPAQNAIFRISSAIGHLFRSALLEKGFVEIHTPKLIAGASEGGADVFKLKYMEGTRFEQPACLAQSPQLYKQMAIMGDLERVFEVGPVFRAENSHTGRHLTEFTGLDFEMEIQESYTEALDVTDFFMVRIFEGLRSGFKRELEVISQQYPFEPLKYSASGPNVRLRYPEGIALLREAGVVNEDGSALDDFQDLSTPQEKRLGAIVRERYGTDFWVLERFPMSVRPFYTMPCADDARYSNSYDVYMRGQEIMSGALALPTVWAGCGFGRHCCSAAQVVAACWASHALPRGCFRSGLCGR
jgi:aspartyl/asparaginyl-tRNA synthetase